MGDQRAQAPKAAACWPAAAAAALALPAGMGLLGGPQQPSAAAGGVQSSRARLAAHNGHKQVGVLLLACKMSVQQQLRGVSQRRAGHRHRRQQGMTFPPAETHQIASPRPSGIASCSPEIPLVLLLRPSAPTSAPHNVFQF